MQALSLANQTVVIREDFNVPLKNGQITHAARIEAALPTIMHARQQGAKIILISHLGRPQEGQFDATFSLAPVAAYLSEALNQPVKFFTLDNPPFLKSGEIALLENVRFLRGEEANAPQLAEQLAQLGDIFVMDAFAVAHRAQASTVGIARYAKAACAGPLLQKELLAIEKILKATERPVVAIVGGAKVSSKLKLLRNLLDKVDILIVGGGIANTFLKAQHCEIGASLYEEALVSEAQSLLQKAQQLGKVIWLPNDVVVALQIEASEGDIKDIKAVGQNDKIFDIGPRSAQEITILIHNAKTVLWNGPLGVFESPAFASGTQALAEAIAASKAFTVAGGGDTLSAIETFKVQDKISYLSTGGGAFLEALEGTILPAVEALINHPGGNS